MASPPLIMTERQALIALARQFQALGEATEDIDIDASLEAALAVVAGALVTEGAALYRPGTLGALTVRPTGEVRVSGADPQVQWLSSSPFAGASPWEGVL